MRWPMSLTVLRKSTRRGLSLDSLVRGVVGSPTLRSPICFIRTPNPAVMFYALQLTVSAHERSSIFCFKSIRQVVWSVITNVSGIINLLFFLEFIGLFDLIVDRGHREWFRGLVSPRSKWSTLLFRAFGHEQSFPWPNRARLRCACYLWKRLSTYPSNTAAILLQDLRRRLLQGLLKLFGLICRLIGDIMSTTTYRALLVATLVRLFSELWLGNLPIASGTDPSSYTRCGQVALNSIRLVTVVSLL